MSWLLYLEGFKVQIPKWARLSQKKELAEHRYTVLWHKIHINMQNAEHHVQNIEIRLRTIQNIIHGAQDNEISDQIRLEIHCFGIISGHLWLCRSWSVQYEFTSQTSQSPRTLALLAFSFNLYSHVPVQYFSVQASRNCLVRHIYICIPSIL